MKPYTIQDLQTKLKLLKNITLFLIEMCQCYRLGVVICDVILSSLKTVTL